MRRSCVDRPRVSRRLRCRTRAGHGAPYPPRSRCVRENIPCCRFAPRRCRGAPSTIPSRIRGSAPPSPGRIPRKARMKSSHADMDLLPQPLARSRRTRGGGSDGSFSASNRLIPRRRKTASYRARMKRRGRFGITIRAKSLIVPTDAPPIERYVVGDGLYYCPDSFRSGSYREYVAADATGGVRVGSVRPRRIRPPRFLA